MLKEPVMTFATATMRPCIARRNLSATTDHYGTHDNLCSTIMSTLEASSNLSTATDLQSLDRSKPEKPAAPMMILARP